MQLEDLTFRCWETCFDLYAFERSEANLHVLRTAVAVAVIEPYVADTAVPAVPFLLLIVGMIDYTEMNKIMLMIKV